MSGFPSGRRIVLLVAALLLSGVGCSLALERFHDPSTIVRCKDEYWLFTTGQGVSSWHSKDLREWQPGPPVFDAPPPWVQEIVPGHKGRFWAPDCIRVGDRYLLYYSVSAWGKNNSAVGLASNPTLDPTDPAYHWTDEGSVVRSSAGRDRFNAIDPSLLLDPAGKLWMAFGSFWSGIELLELDPATGKQRSGADTPVRPLAFHKEIEASCLVAHDGAFFLFVDWGLCCRGTRSTYEIRVGRSDRATGPYRDRDGVDLRVDGGSLFLGNEGTRIGPGHAGVFEEKGRSWLSYHFYDATRGGSGTLAVRSLQWGADGWPIPGPLLVPQAETVPAQP